MKVCILIAGLLVTGALVARFLPKTREPNNIAEIVSQLKQEFRAQTPSLGDFNISALKKTRTSAELIEPETILPQSTRFPHEEISALYRYAESCQGQVSTMRLRKAKLWHQFLCGDLKTLPPKYFEQIPLMHPSGVSFVRLAIESGRGEFEAPVWRAKYFSYLHVMEVLRTQKLESLKPWELANILRGEDLIVGQQFVILRRAQTVSQDGFYDIFDRTIWDQKLAKLGFHVSTHVDAPTCLMKEGNICWARTDRSRLSPVFIWVVLAVIATLTLFLLFGFFRQVQERREHNRRQVLMLQMLTHELRTPATALSLTLESFRREFDSLSQDLQKSFLQMCEELQRLNRVVDASQNYLHARQGTMKDSTVYDANALVQSMLGRVGEDCVFIPLTQEVRFVISPYWLELCLRNLIQNAKVHGRAPIQVTLKQIPDLLLIEVQDQGSLDIEKNVTQPFVKGSQSGGLGLGLTIVDQVCKTLGGKLLIRGNPTTFTISLRIQS